MNQNTEPTKPTKLKRRRYDEQFKRDAVALLEGGRGMRRRLWGRRRFCGCGSFIVRRRGMRTSRRNWRGSSISPGGSMARCQRRRRLRLLRRAMGQSRRGARRAAIGGRCERRRTKGQTDHARRSRRHILQRNRHQPPQRIPHANRSPRDDHAPRRADQSAVWLILELPPANKNSSPANRTAVVCFLRKCRFSRQPVRP